MSAKDLEIIKEMIQNVTKVPADRRDYLAGYIKAFAEIQTELVPKKHNQ